MEEMKKHGEELNSQNPLLAGVTLAGQKRASPEAGSGLTGTGNNSSEGLDINAATSKKLAKVDGAGANTPDSPGSPGAMVIDERPEDGPSSKSENKEHTTGTGNDPAGKAANPAVTKPASAASAAAATANTASTSSKYEPLSDDE
jgi:hypothetical protein